MFDTKAGQVAAILDSADVTAMRTAALAALAVQTLGTPGPKRLALLGAGPVAARIAEASNLTVALGKQAYYTQIDLDQTKAYAYTKEVMAMNSLAGDAQEGITAFTQKRKPVFRGQ